jgi:hypothetical protein
VPRQQAQRRPSRGSHGGSRRARQLTCLRVVILNHDVETPSRSSRAAPPLCHDAHKIAPARGRGSSDRQADFHSSAATRRRHGNF